MMWKYYELLTDASIDAITVMKQKVSSGEWHPMEAKKNLAQAIVNDFHSQEFGSRAGEDWAKQFQKNEVPEEIEEVGVRYEDVRSDDKGAGVGGDLLIIRIDRLLVRCGLAESASEATRKLKAGSVKFVNIANGRETMQRFLEIPVIQGSPIRLVVRVGKKIRAALIEV
jgi:tyrosyl-tRNA synthetase